MQILSATKDTKEKLQKKSIEKRNLFGLGVTSLIAACSGADKAAGGGGEKTPPLPFTAEALSGTKADGKSGFTAARGGDADQFTFEVKEAETTKATLIFTEGTNADSNLAPKAEIYKLTATEGQYDLVISAANIDTETGLDRQEGRIFIFWNLAVIKDETISKNVTPATIINNYLEVKGAYRGDVIGTFAPEFLQIGGVDNNYDMIIRSTEVDKPAVDDGRNIGGVGALYILWDVADYTGKKTIDLGIGNNDGDLYATSGLLTIYGARTEDYVGSLAPEFLQIGGTDNNYDMAFTGKYLERSVDTPNTGAIVILWDVADYAGKNKTIDLDPAKLDDDDDSADILGQGATSGYLAIYGGLRDDNIGTHAPEFLQIGGTDNNYDMVIRSELVDNVGSNAGAIYILWDVADYAGKNKIIDLGNLDEGDPAASLGEGATSGSLTIYGVEADNKIGSLAPEFLQIGGTDNNYDMVFAGLYFQGTGSTGGAIFILWDVADYAGKNKVIDLDNLDQDDPAASLGEGATSGSLGIYGSNGGDQIGTHAPEFLQIGGTDNNYDMVIRSEWVDSALDADNNKGAIYILWDVADYYKDTSDQIANKSIDLGAASSSLDNYASSGLLTIYGVAAEAKLGSDANNILYNADGELTNIDGDTAGTKDIAFRDKDYTYILFGDKVADTGDDDKVDSKTIDLANIITVENAADTAGDFFNYDFGGTVVTRVGYRFASGTGSDGDAGYQNLAEVQTAYTAANPVSLSDTDADLGVWDIA